MSVEGKLILLATSVSFALAGCQAVGAQKEIPPASVSPNHSLFTATPSPTLPPTIPPTLSENEVLATVESAVAQTAEAIITKTPTPYPETGVLHEIVEKLSKSAVKVELLYRDTQDPLAGPDAEASGAIIDKQDGLKILLAAHSLNRINAANHLELSKVIISQPQLDDRSWTFDALNTQLAYEVSPNTDNAIIAIKLKEAETEKLPFETIPLNTNFDPNSPDEQKLAAYTFSCTFRNYGLNGYLDMLPISKDTNGNAKTYSDSLYQDQIMLQGATGECTSGAPIANKDGVVGTISRGNQDITLFSPLSLDSTLSDRAAAKLESQDRYFETFTKALDSIRQSIVSLGFETPNGTAKEGIGLFFSRAGKTYILTAKEDVDPTYLKNQDGYGISIALDPGYNNYWHIGDDKKPSLHISNNSDFAIIGPEEIPSTYNKGITMRVNSDSVDATALTNFLIVRTTSSGFSIIPVYGPEDLSNDLDAGLNFAIDSSGNILGQVTVAEGKVQIQTINIEDILK